MPIEKRIVLLVDEWKAIRNLPVVIAERLGYLRDGRAIELSQSIYRGDTYDVVAELSESP